MEEAHPGVAFIGVEGLRGGEGFVGVVRGRCGVVAHAGEKKGERGRGERA